MVGVSTPSGAPLWSHLPDYSMPAYQEALDKHTRNVVFIDNEPGEITYPPDGTPVDSTQEIMFVQEVRTPASAQSVQASIWEGPIAPASAAWGRNHMDRQWRLLHSEHHRP